MIYIINKLEGGECYVHIGFCLPSEIVPNIKTELVRRGMNRDYFDLEHVEGLTYKMVVSDIFLANKYIKDKLKTKVMREIYEDAIKNNDAEALKHYFIYANLNGEKIVVDHLLSKFIFPNTNFLKFYVKFSGKINASQFNLIIETKDMEKILLIENFIPADAYFSDKSLFILDDLIEKGCKNEVIRIFDKALNKKIGQFHKINFFAIENNLLNILDYTLNLGNPDIYMEKILKTGYRVMLKRFIFKFTKPIDLINARNEWEYGLFINQNMRLHLKEMEALAELHFNKQSYTKPTKKYLNNTAKSLIKEYNL